MTKEDIEQKYKESYKDLVKFATIILHDEEKAKDVVQEVFTRLLSYKGHVKMKTFHTWMLKRIVLYIQRYIFLNRNSKNYSHHYEIFTEDLKSTRDEGFTPEFHDDEFLQKALDAAVAALTAKEQEVVAMVVFGGLPYNQVAKLLQADYSTVRQRYKTGIRKMRLALESVGIEDPSSFYSIEPATGEFPAA